jgi:hypothetical protein
MSDFDMTGREPTIAAIAAAIISNRGATDIADLKQAWTDAKFIIYPDPADAAYRSWQVQSNAAQQTSIRRVS